MKDGQVKGLPLGDLRTLREGIELQATMQGVVVRFSVEENSNGTVDVAWFVTEKVGVPADAMLGTLSRRFEVGDRGPEAISSGIGDPGSKSYGSWQMTSRPKGGTVTRFVNELGFAFAAEFNGLVAGSTGFDGAWTRVAKSDPAGFEEIQRGFILRTHYEPALIRLRAEGIDVAARSHAMGEVLWSTAVQHGPAGGAAIFIAAAAAVGKGAEDAKLIKAVYAERGRRDGEGTLVHFASSSRPVQESVIKRFLAEQNDALAMLAAEEEKPQAEALAAGGKPTWYSIAEEELGTAETAGTTNNRRIREYFSWTSLGEQPDSVPWCGAFVAFCMGGAGFLRKGTGSARAADWLRFGIALEEPRPGCIVVLDKQAPGTSGHVAFFVKTVGDSIHLLGGNQRDRVEESSFKLKDVRQFGYRWPNGG